GRLAHGGAHAVRRMDRRGRAGGAAADENRPRAGPGPRRPGRAGHRVQRGARPPLPPPVRGAPGGPPARRPTAPPPRTGEGGAGDHGAGGRRDVTAPPGIEDVLRELAPQVLGPLVRRFGHFDACEDAVQEALIAATVQWPAEGVPHNPRGWLVTVASRRVTDQLRSDEARRRPDGTTAKLAPPGAAVAPDRDGTLTLLFLCCHPALSPPSQLALTLRAVGGLTTAQIASAFLVPETTMAQRISRAKQRIKGSGARFEPPAEGERAERLGVVLHVLYLVFNEGYTATSGPHLQRTDLTAEAIRLTRVVHRLLPDDGEVAGLLALMLLTDARRPARSRPDGSLVPLEEQDRSRWDQDAIKEGVVLVTDALARAPIGPYQLQA